MNRTRYTVTTQKEGVGVQRQVVLCYTAQWATDYFTRRGFVVLSVQKGDYRKQQRVAATKAAGGFTIDRKALAAAIEQLGLKLPVKIRYNARVGGTQGNYRLRNGNHDIMLKSYLTPEQASSTLWHELTHAMQAERVGGTSEVWNSYSLEQRRYSYSIRPIEIEARQMSKIMADVPLCR